MSIKEEGVSYATLLRDMHKDNSIWVDVQKYMEQERSNKLKYVSLIGNIGAGKDYVANYIAQNVERKCEVVKFATKLTQITGAILGVDDLSLFQDRDWKEQANFIWQSNITSNNGKLISPREAQKIIGTDICRSILGDNVWVDAFAREYNDPDILYIISDLRFENEMQFVQQNNGVVVFIENRDAVQAQWQKECINGIHHCHPSEKLTWSLFFGDNQNNDYWLDNSDYSNPQPLRDLVTFLSTV